MYAWIVKRVATALFGRLNRGDIRPIMAAMADDIHFVFPGGGTFGGDLRDHNVSWVSAVPTMLARLVGALDAKATRGVGQLRFQPGLLRGRIVAVVPSVVGDDDESRLHGHAVREGPVVERCPRVP